MRVLIFTQFFSPEIGATQTRLHTFAAGLAERGHNVTVICEVPNHPQGVVRPGYRNRVLVRQRREGFRVIHVWVKTSPDKTRLSRLAFYASYAAMATAVGCAQKRPDVVFASSPPLPVAAAAAAVAARHRVPWVFDVRDLWPEAAVALGELSDGRVLDLIQKLADGLYENASAVTVVTEPFRQVIASKVAASTKVTHLPNGTTRFWLDSAGLDVDRQEFDWPEDCFVWTFAGNVGAAQGLTTAVDTAAALKNEGFRLLILGDGPARSELEARAAEFPGAVWFLPQVPPDVAVRYLRSSDALLVPLAADPALADFVPSKLYDFCAVGRPVVIAAAGEASRIASQAGAAVCVEPEDPLALAHALRRLKRDHELCARLQASGRGFAASNLRETQVDRLVEVLREAGNSVVRAGSLG